MVVELQDYEVPYFLSLGAQLVALMTQFLVLAWYFPSLQT